MSDSREESPDWLREFKAPTRDFVALSSDSDSSPKASPRKSEPVEHDEPEKHPKEEDAIFVDSGDDSRVHKSKKSKSPRKTKKHNIVEDTVDAPEDETVKENPREKPAGPPVSSRLPLVFPDKVQRSKALVECDGDSIDLSGDVGAVGRIVIAKGTSGSHEMLLDLKGTIYKSTIVPSRTFCIVSVGQSEAKIEAIMNDFIQLEPQSNVFEAETMVEGTLDGFSFDSEEEGDKMPKPSSHQQPDGNDENGDPASKKTKRKVEKSTGVAHKKAKTAGKPPKKGARKTPAVKKTRKSKK